MEQILWSCFYFFQFVIVPWARKTETCNVSWLIDKWVATAQRIRQAATRGPRMSPLDSHDSSIFSYEREADVCCVAAMSNETEVPWKQLAVAGSALNLLLSLWHREFGSVCAAWCVVCNHSRYDCHSIWWCCFFVDGSKGRFTSQLLKQQIVCSVGCRKTLDDPSLSVPTHIVTRKWN